MERHYQVANRTEQVGGKALKKYLRVLLWILGSFKALRTKAGEK